MRKKKNRSFEESMGSLNIEINNVKQDLDLNQKKVKLLEEFLVGHLTQNASSFEMPTYPKQKFQKIRIT